MGDHTKRYLLYHEENSECQQVTICSTSSKQPKPKQWVTIPYQQPARLVPTTSCLHGPETASTSWFLAPLDQNHPGLLPKLKNMKNLSTNTMSLTQKIASNLKQISRRPEIDEAFRLSTSKTGRQWTKLAPDQSNFVQSVKQPSKSLKSRTWRTPFT